MALMRVKTDVWKRHKSWLKETVVVMMRQMKEYTHLYLPVLFPPLFSLPLNHTGQPSLQKHTAFKGKGLFFEILQKKFKNLLTTKPSVWNFSPPKSQNKNSSTQTPILQNKYLQQRLLNSGFLSKGFLRSPRLFSKAGLWREARSTGLVFVPLTTQRAGSWVKQGRQGSAGLLLILKRT